MSDSPLVVPPLTDRINHILGELRLIGGRLATIHADLDSCIAERERIVQTLRDALTDFGLDQRLLRELVLVTDDDIPF